MANVMERTAVGDDDWDNHMTDTDIGALEDYANDAHNRHSKPLGRVVLSRSNVTPVNHGQERRAVAGIAPRYPLGIGRVIFGADMPFLFPTN